VRNAETGTDAFKTQQNVCLLLQSWLLDTKLIKGSWTIFANGIQHTDIARVCSFEKVIAIKDQKAACAILRYYGSSWVDTGSTLKGAIKDVAVKVFAYMAKEKLQQKSARPHFTRKEQNKIKAELGLGMCAESLYVCINCNKKPPEDVTLSRCSQCLGMWYCRKKCRTVHWRESRHKERCRKDAATTTTGLPDSHRANNEEQIVAYGYAPVRGSWFETGELFESLTNQHVCFGAEGLIRATAHANGWCIWYYREAK
jgi:hypothetical protein